RDFRAVLALRGLRRRAWLGDRPAPHVEFHLGLGRCGVVAVAEERELLLFAVPREPLVAALASQNGEGRLGVARRDRVDAVGLLLGPRGDRVDEQPAVLAERVLHHVRNGLFVAIRHPADDQVAAGLPATPAAALHLARRRTATAAAAA